MIPATDIKPESNISQPKVENVEKQPIIEKETPINESISTPTEVISTPEDENWKTFREGRKRDTALRLEAERKAHEKEQEALALKAAMEAAFSKQPQPQQNYFQESADESEDERIEKKVQAAIAKREKEYESQRIEREARELPYKLRQQFPDYDQVMNEENGAYLEYHHPEIYRSLLRQGESFEALSDSYKAVKKLIPNIGNAKKDAMKAESNMNKPKSMSSSSISPLSQSKEGTMSIEARRAERYREMQKIIKGV